MYPKVNFRYTISPSEPVDSSLYFFDWEVAKLMKLGMKDAENAVKDNKKYFNEMVKKAKERKHYVIAE